MVERIGETRPHFFDGQWWLMVDGEWQPLDPDADPQPSGFVRCPFCDAILPPGSVIDRGGPDV